jgi:hypothetical protein
MKMNMIISTAFLASALLTACHPGASKAQPLKKVPAHSGTGSQGMQSGQATYRALLAAGKVYRFSGHLSNLNVSFVNGKARVEAHAVPGDYLDISFVKAPRTVFDLRKPAEHVVDASRR